MYTFAFILMTLLAAALWLGAYHEFITPNPTTGWVSSGKYGSQAVTSYSIYFVTAVVTFVWIGGLCAVVDLWRGRSAEG
ncbi:MAG: hypothetical protein AAGF49_10775 [Pseudomonadota bacterium]